MPSLRNQLLRPAEDPETRWGDPPPPQTGQLPMNALAVPRPANDLMAPEQQQPNFPPNGQQGSYPQAVPQPSAAPGDEHRVSTAIPTSKRLTFDPHETQHLISGMRRMLPQGFKKSDNIVPEKHYDEALSKVEGSLRTHAERIRHDEEHSHINTHGLSDLGVMERFVEHAHDNITWLFNKAKQEPWSGEALHWYDGANQLAAQMAKRFGTSHRQAAAVLAALSPNKDWDQNVNLAERLLRSRTEASEYRVSDKMRARMRELADKRKNPAAKAQLHAVINAIPRGARYKDLADPMHQALFLRTYDELTNKNRGYDTISPTGARQPAMTKPDDKGRQKPKTVVWQSLPAISNAIRALSEVDPGSEQFRSLISRSLGGNHKVRNFYNNIIAPNSKWGDVTADTHAINVAHLLPMGAGHPFVGYGLGTAGAGNPNVTGAKGIYGLHHEAYRRAAQTLSRMEGRPILPREVQSLTWEAIRNMFEAKHKKVAASGFPLHPMGLHAHGLAHAARHGLMSPHRAREALFQQLGGIKPPSWRTGIARDDEGEEEDEE